MATHKCSECNEIKSITEFSPRKNKKGEITSYRSECKKCRCKKESQRRQDNKDKYKEKDKQYYEKNKEKINERSKQYNKEHREEICANKKEYYQKNKDVIKEYHDKNKEKRNIRVRQKRKTCIQTRVCNSLRSRLSDAVKKAKSNTFIKLLGCTKVDLLNWIQDQFNENMSWNNYGKYWQIDHVVPISWFDLQKKTHQLVCFHWTNLRPLLKEINMKKKDKIISKEITKHIAVIEQYIEKKEDQSNYESMWWRRLKLRYGNTSQDEEFEEILKWTIRMQDAIEEA